MSDLTLNEISQALQNIRRLLDKEWEDAPTMRQIQEELGLSTNTTRKWMDRFERETGFKIIGKRVRKPTRVEGEFTMVPVYRIKRDETVD